MPGWGQLAVGRRRSGALAIVLTLLLGVFIIWGLAYVGVETRSTLETVFAAAETTTTTTTTMTTTTTTTLLATTSTGATTSTVAETETTTTTSPPATTTTTTTTTTTLPDPIEARLNVLLLGGDAGPRRSGLRTDSVIVVSVDRYTGDTAIFSIPRNYGGLTLADGSRAGDRILNEVYQWASRRPDQFPGEDPGATALVEIAQHITGLDIDHYVLMDLTGFGDVIDALGGVTIDVPRQVYGPRYNPATGGYTMITIRRGEQTLDGDEALAYVRARYGSSDYTRMERQRCLLAALVDDLDPMRLLTGLPALLTSIEENVTTDFPVDSLPDLIRLAGKVPADDISVIGFDNRWRRGWDSRGYAIPDEERIRAAIHSAITHPEDAEETFGIVDAEAACG
jgi:polyisoprenyl-teichoic acid--peptidoglycan teichoic acid transferase